MLYPKTWLCVAASLLIFASAFFVALPRVSASPDLAHKPAAPVSQRYTSAPARHALSTGDMCPYSTVNTAVIVDFDKWNDTAYFCGTGYVGHEIDRANDIYDNGGGPMWVKWYTGSQGHFCSINGPGAYWNFKIPVKITQIDYGNDHTGSYCP